MDGRVQGVPLQAAAAVPQNRRRRHEGAARGAREAQVQAVLVVHARGRLGPREVPPYRRAAAFCRRRGMIYCTRTCTVSHTEAYSTVV